MYESGETVHPATQAEDFGLRYVTGLEPGIRRKKRGKHFHFFMPDGARITDDVEIARIRKLAIPPAYRDVWICADPSGHLQATGIDARGRKQYRYHPDWRCLRDGTKFSHILNFAAALPKLRATVAEHMAQRGLSREKVLATVVALLERTMIRVGNDDYAKQNDSYGLTTLRDDHVEVKCSQIRFRFKGKSGKQWNLKLTDRRIAHVIKACADVEGLELFKYVDDNGVVRDVTSGDVNAYLKEITGSCFTAKDFRTWTGTVLAAIALHGMELGAPETRAKRYVKEAVERVAARLGNTPSVCRKCYIHPKVIDAYLEGTLALRLTSDIETAVPGELGVDEKRVLAFLKKRLG
ncbi:DNA topoisomerase I [Asticcacaulis biprosthecium C19]|uniref:DNA topoisomerase n=1 Tax=Asticcacaulis biprosthecium C19 TaxID=715226 RepID=F4QKI7_9CAUL|nr:DNA topoisomerase IB [Asticcacaulis biprosthecium]EGF92139.1 DNA topoisomerase I [Asticcacaulis biprosthecium C19]